MTGEKPTVTFGPSALETVLEQFGWHIGEDGEIRGEDGAPAPSFGGTPVYKDEVGGVVKGKKDEPVLVRNDFNSIVEYVEHNEQ